jgi:large subunit ribosomal protein L19e
MIYKIRKKIAARLLKCSPKRVKLDPNEMAEIKEAITKDDLRGLIKDNVIQRIPKKGVSRVRAKEKQKKKARGQGTGLGKRKGKATARTPKKKKWMNAIRLQRKFLKELKDKEMLTTKTYRNLYMKSKGGFFRSKRHITIYMNEHNLIEKKQVKGTNNGKKE